MRVARPLNPWSIGEYSYIGYAFDGYANTNQLVTQSGTTSVSANDPNSCCASQSIQATVSLSPAPSLSISGTVSASGGADATASVTNVGNVSLQYSFEVNGPAGDVPITVNAFGAASGNSVDAAFEIALADININLPTGAGSWILNTTTDFQADTVYTVYMDVQGGAGCGPAYLTGIASCTNSFNATVDPTFQIAAGFANANEYTLVSPGIGNISATPLPAALPLFAAGLGAMGLLGWRRSRKKAAIAA